MQDGARRGGKGTTMRPISPEEFEPARPAVHKHLIDQMMETRGKRTPGTLWIIDTKYRLLRMMARCFFAGLSERQASAAIVAKVEQYRCRGAWRRDRLEHVCPARHHGKVEEVMFTLLKIRDASVSIGTCRRALSAIREPRARG